MSGDPTSEMGPGDEAPPGTPGAGENICPTCGGAGKLDGAACQTCGGTGQLEGAACETCAGTGVVIEEVGGA